MVASCCTAVDHGVFLASCGFGALCGFSASVLVSEGTNIEHSHLEGHCDIENLVQILRVSYVQMTLGAWPSSVAHPFFDWSLPSVRRRSKGRSSVS